MPVVTAPAEPTHEIPGARFTALVGPRLGAVDTSVWRVRVAPGGEGQTHRLTREEVLVVLAGRARVAIGGEVGEAGPGDAVLVPAGVDFALSCAGDEALEAVCALPVGGQAVVAGGAPFTPPWAA